MIVFLLHLAGAAALLIWAVRLIRTGVERAFMPRLRLLLRRTEKNRLLAALGGAGSAMVLQSATAVALIVAGFTLSSGLAGATALTIVLGADLGSAVAANLLMLRAGWLVPLLLLIGAALFLKGRTRPVRQSGRILIGLALVFVSIDMIGAATEPLRENRLVAMILAYLDGDLLSAFLIGMALTYLVHSSLAAILMFASIAAAGVLSAQTGAALVLGANAGGAIIPFALTLSMPVAARRVLLANLGLRGGGALAALALLAGLRPDLALLGASAHGQMLGLHLAFNLALLLTGLAFAGPLTALLPRLMPERPGAALDGPASALNPKALDDPERALACASREILRMAEQVVVMLAPALRLYRTWNADTAAEIERIEDAVDRMHFETKLYLAQLQDGPLTGPQSRRAIDLATIANNLEEAGDQISTNLLGMAERMAAEALAFSPEGWGDLSDFHDRVAANAQLGLDLLMSGEVEVARQLVEEKDRIRRTEQELQTRHLRRLRGGSAQSVATSNLHQETLRSLKQINTAMCSIAYPIVEEAGDLLSSRLSGPTPTPAPKPKKKKSARKDAPV